MCAGHIRATRFGGWFFSRDSEPTLFIFLFVLARTRGCINSLAPGEDTRTSLREAGTGNEWAVRSQAWHTSSQRPPKTAFCHKTRKRKRKRVRVCAIWGCVRQRKLQVPLPGAAPSEVADFPRWRWFLSVLHSKDESETLPQGLNQAVTICFFLVALTYFSFSNCCMVERHH